MLRTLFGCALTCAIILGIPHRLDSQTLRGSPASVDRIYRQALDHGLDFYGSASAIRRAVEAGELVRLSGNSDYTLVNVSYPYAIPAAYTFVVRLASQYRAACGEQMVVTSATRPTSMVLRNSSDRSVHPTGMAIDLRKPTNSRCLRWLRDTLLALDATGVVDSVEERNPPHFHVAIFPSQYQRYVSARPGPQVTSAAPSVRAASSSDGGSTRYQVRRGDSLWTIARRNDVSVEDLRQANNLRGSRILAGQVLVIPPAR